MKRVIAIGNRKREIFYTVREASEFFGCTEHSIEVAIENGTPIHHKTGDYYLDELLEISPAGNTAKSDEGGQPVNLEEDMIEDSEPQSYRKKPVTIKAIRWNGRNFSAIQAFAGDSVVMEDGELIVRTLEDGKTGKAKHAATVGDFVVRGVRGEFYFCKPDIFAETYERVD